MRKYVIDFRSYTADDVNSTAPIESNCNAITFKNLGDATVNINGLPLTQYRELAIGGLEGEMDKTVYEATFGAGSVREVWVLRKIYVNEE